MHRVLNFVEDIYRLVEKPGLGSVRDIDHYGNGCFTVRVASARHLGEVSTTVLRLLRQHMLEQDAVVNRSDRKRPVEAK